MDEYISRNEAINAIKNLESSMPAKDNYAKGYDAALGRVLIAVREAPPAADVISRKEVLELIESFKVESTHELSKSDFDRNDTLRLLQDVIKGVTWEDVL